MKRYLLSAVIGLAVLGLSGCEKDNSIPPTPLSAVAPSQIDVAKLWSLNVGVGTDQQYLLLSPTVAGNVVATVGYNGELTVLNANTRRLFWQKQLDFKVGAPVAIDEGRLIVAGLNGMVSAFDLYSGTLLWTTQVSSSVLAAPAAASELVILHTHNDDVIALNARTGSTVWTANGNPPALTLATDSSPVITGQSVVVGAQNGVLEVFNLKTGVLRWSRPIAIASGSTEIARMIDITSTPIVQNGVIYAVGYHGNAVAVQLDNGNLIWEHPMSAFANMTLINHRVFITDENSSVWALDQDTGRVLWVQNDLKYRSVSAPEAINHNDIAVGDYAGYVHWLSTYTGAVLTRVKISDGGISAQPVEHNGLAYVTTNDGTLVVLKPSR